MTVGVAVVGYGYWGPNLVRNFQRHAGCQVRWVCDPDAGSRERAAQDWPGVQRAAELGPVLADPAVELVAVATPIPTHFPLAKAALEAGRHVLVEKPLTGDLAEAEALLALAGQVGKRLFVDHTYLFTPEVREIKRQLDDGELGELLYLDAVRINLGLFRHDHDVLWDLAPHDVSIFLHLLGRSPESVLATGAAHTPSGLADIAMVHLDFGGGLVAHAHVNWLSPVKIRHTIVAGTKSMLVYNDLDPAEKIHVYDRGIEIDDDVSRRAALPEYRHGDMRAPYIAGREALAVQTDELVACLRGEGEPTSPGALGVEVVRVLSALSESLASGGKRIAL